MKHNHLSDEDLKVALALAAQSRPGGIAVVGDTGEDAWFASEFSDLRAILDHLPEPVTDEWKTYFVATVRKGDRVRWTVPGSKDNESYEIVVAAVIEEDGYVLHSETSSYYFLPGAVIDRIPNQVVHPNPDEHQYILVHEYQGRNGRVTNYAQKSFEWDKNSKRYVNRNRSLSPEFITNWDALEIVAGDGRE